MKLRSLVGSAISCLSNLRRRALVVAGAGALAGGLVIGGLNADVIDFEDFEGLTLLPFDIYVEEEPVEPGDGTDWTNNIPGWTIDNSAMNGTSSEGAYNGVTAMDVDSWIDQQGVQIGRTSSGQLGTEGSRNTALIFDPDGWDDRPGGNPAFAYNSYISREYDLSGRDLSTLEISLDYEFATEASDHGHQRGVVDVSFDGGNNWSSLLDIDSTDFGNGTILSGPGVFTAGSDFAATSSTMIIRIGCIEAGNNWWFGVDNVQVADGDGVIELEDFEGLTLEPFTETYAEESFYKADGTDYTQDIPNWVIDNSNMFSPSPEGAFNGWAALDIESWIAEQGGQDRSSLDFFENNTVLVADADAWEDYAEEYDAQGFNSYITRTYDISGYQRSSISIELWYEFRVEDTQRGLIDVSFDGGNTWQNLLDLDSDLDSDEDGETDLADGSIILGEPASWSAGSGGDFQVNGDQMMLRFGCVEAGNDWWFAIDEVKIEGTPLEFPLGDANGDGSFNNNDIEPFVMALINRPMFESTYPSVDLDTVMDFDGDGAFNNNDIEGFVSQLIGG